MILSIIIPCYNEEESLDYLESKLNPVLKKLQKDYELDLIFIDDGSTDNTNKLLHKKYDKFKYARIITHKNNMNLGVAIRTGYKHAKGDLILTNDSDCTYEPSEIINILQLLDKDTDIVTASPYHPKGAVDNIPEYRLFLSRTISWIYSIILRKKIFTYTALFRVVRRRVLENVKITNNDFMAVAQLLIFAILKGYKVKEYPTTLHVRKFGTSKMKLFKVIWSHFKFILFILNVKFLGKKI